MRPRILLALALITPAVLACESGLLPQPQSELAGTFILDVSDGPVVLQNRQLRMTLLADTLRLKSDGTAVRSARMHYDHDSFRDTTLNTTLPYRHHIEGFRVEMEHVCPPNALCTAPPHLWGTVTRDELVLHAVEDPRPRLRYRRIGEGVVPYSN